MINTQLLIFDCVLVLLVILAGMLVTNKENFNEIMDAPKTPNDVSIVYFAYLNPDRWETIVTGQMIDLKDCGLLQEGAHLHTVLCSDNDKD
jgi:hypothetical protein